ncbi:MAG: 4Fe-4S binding protein [Chloroflexia bacterium]|nr:4Fe-4S binding protein [Chloroflexia bacterium]
MPWVDGEMCTGCGICIDECCVGAISMEADIAWIDEDGCIRCGICHDVCPTDAVRHDRERIPAEVQANLAWVRELLGHEYYSKDKVKQKGLLKRLQRHFDKNREVMDKTLEHLERMLQTEYAD